MQLYPGVDTFAFDQRHRTKNQPITVLNLLSENFDIIIVINLRFSKDDPFSIKKKEQKKSLPSNNPNQITVEQNKNS